MSDVLAVVPDTKPSPRMYVLDLAGEAFANGRDAEAKELRTLADSHDFTEFENVASYLADLWTCVASAVRAERDAEEEAKTAKANALPLVQEDAA